MLLGLIHARMSVSLKSGRAFRSSEIGPITARRARSLIFTPTSNKVKANNLKRTRFWNPIEHNTITDVYFFIFYIIFYLFYFIFNYQYIFYILETGQPKPQFINRSSERWRSGPLTRTTKSAGKVSSSSSWCWSTKAVEWFLGRITDRHKRNTLLTK